MGRTYDKKIYLSPEETLFLVDEGILDLRVDLNGDSLSLQEAFNLTLTNQLTLEQYQVILIFFLKKYLLREIIINVNIFRFIHI